MELSQKEELSGELAEVWLENASQGLANPNLLGNEKLKVQRLIAGNAPRTYLAKDNLLGPRKA